MSEGKGRIYVFIDEWFLDREKPRRRRSEEQDLNMGHFKYHPGGDVHSHWFTDSHAHK